MLSLNGNNGAVPYAGLVLGKDGFFYGNAFLGGTYDDGMLFRITTSGSLSTLKLFNGNNGENPVAGLVQASDTNLYGTAYEGGTFNAGTVFRMTTGGTMTTLVTFNGY